jgi:hypothetical protein
MEMSAEMRSALRNPCVKMAWVNEPDTRDKTKCQNCGGEGYLFLFLATEGPFDNKPQKVSKWYEGKWWVGETLSFFCPVCAVYDTGGMYKLTPDKKMYGQLELEEGNDYTDH